MLIPYNVPSKLRRGDGAKWIFAYISSKACETEAWETIGFVFLIIVELLGSFLKDQLVLKIYDMPDNTKKSLLPVILLGDHRELNIILGIYANACRKCFKQRETNTWLMRTKERMTESYKCLASGSSSKEISYLTFNFQQHLPINSLGVIKFNNGTN